MRIKIESNNTYKHLYIKYAMYNSIHTAALVRDFFFSKVFLEEYSI